MELVVIGCSTGGLRALQVLLGGLAPCPATAFVAAIHTASADTGLLCELLAPWTSMPVVEAQERTPVRSGTLQLAPPGYHLLIGTDRHFQLSVDPKISFVRPSVTVLLESAAAAYRDRLAGVILTGANDDGAAGLLAVRAHGGLALVQDPLEAQAPAMPQAALDLAGADHCLSLAGLAATLNRICKT
ncbi:Chemotaxis response regulator protein-glutamate methylesterase [Pigmentiphaga humi]|uniref:protein-glutamate methylesterase n=1 Tax=Pigmentiphaga humi TaxID=2478468 RepID=A0A3P4B748_9BURK|nr:chemotaxis protein CheB [Pigmentiphaga humi]VCU72124.1 Chemotaxis response regulator protein-glutamate methylesterase [Pigmentiphaga humi]